MLTQKDIIAERQRLEGIVKKLNIEIEGLRKFVPETEKLRVIKHGAGYQYFVRSKPSQKTGSYIQKKDLIRAQRMAQLEYDEKVVSHIFSELEKLKELEELVGTNPDIFSGREFHPGKISLISFPAEIESTDGFISKWINQDYLKLGFRENAHEFYAKNGIRVRSKSEVLIANMLIDLGMFFLYEKPLDLGDAVVHPDFTILDVRNRREIYWEHFGMMDDPEYRTKAFGKICMYETNGYYLGDGFVCSFETMKKPLNVRDVRCKLMKLKEAAY